MISATGQVPNRLTLNKTMLPENYQKRSFFRFDTPVDLQRLTDEYRDYAKCFGYSSGSFPVHTCPL